MPQMCVTKEAKDWLLQKKKELAEAKGVHESKVSYTDTIKWLCESLPTSKGEKLRVASDRYKQEIIILAGQTKHLSPLCEFLDDVRYILQKIIVHPERAKDYGEGIKVNIDKVNAKYPSTIFPPTKRINNVADDGSTMDKQS